jgi:hypothetical protein
MCVKGFDEEKDVVGPNENFLLSRATVYFRAPCMWQKVR